MPMPKTQSIETILKRDFSKAQAWLREMMDILPGHFHPDADFRDYVDPATGHQRFTGHTAEMLNQSLYEAHEMFNYHCTAPGDDIYSFCLDYQNKTNERTNN
jgi:hypothetical protein